MRFGLFARPVSVTSSVAIGAAVSVACLLGACGGGDDPPQDQPVTITVAGPNAVSTWNEIASATVNVPGTATGTPEEQRPNYAADLATVHVAIYDAVMAIVGTHQPYAVIPPSAAGDASQEAAVGSAGYRVLLGLFPARTAQYQAAYDGFIETGRASAVHTRSRRKRR